MSSALVVILTRLQKSIIWILIFSCHCLKDLQEVVMDIKDTQIWFKNELFSLKQNLNSKFLSASKDLLCCPPCVKSWPNLTKKLGRSKIHVQNQHQLLSCPMYILQNKFHLDFIIPKDPLSSKILLLQNSEKSQYCTWSLKNLCLYQFENRK